jgi:hypothetical protein
MLGDLPLPRLRAEIAVAGKQQIGSVVQSNSSLRDLKLCQASALAQLYTDAALPTKTRPRQSDDQADSMRRSGKSQHSNQTGQQRRLDILLPCEYTTHHIPGSLAELSYAEGMTHYLALPSPDPP